MSDLASCWNATYPWRPGVPKTALKQKQPDVSANKLSGMSIAQQQAKVTHCPSGSEQDTLYSLERHVQASWVGKHAMRGSYNLFKWLYPSPSSLKTLKNVWFCASCGARQVYHFESFAFSDVYWHFSKEKYSLCWDQTTWYYRLSRGSPCQISVINSCGALVSRIPSSTPRKVKKLLIMATERTSSNTS